jgi:hypothetical protein
MIVITVTPQKLVLSNYNRGSGDISLLYNDGKDRMVSKRMAMDNPDAIAADLMRTLRRQIKEQNRPAYLEDDPLTDTVVLRFSKDEEEIETKIKVFLARVNAKAKGMGQQKGGMGYLNSWNSMRGMEVEF